MNERDAMNAVIEGMLRYTIKLVRAEPGKLHVGKTGKAGVASGFIVPVNKHFRIVSAGHAIGAYSGWAVELLPVRDTKTLMLTVSNVQTVATIIPKDGSDELDLAWADVDPAKLAEQLKNDPEMGGLAPELPVYYGPLEVEPDPEKPYGFAAWNQTEFHQVLSTLLRENSCELNMRYLETDTETGLYRFELARQHQGHDYYHGASGAPISGIDGRIVSMLVGGDKDAAEKCLYGIPLRSYASRLLAPSASQEPAQRVEPS